MKIIVLHGDYQTRIYERLSKFMEIAKKRGWDIVNDEIVQTPSLFNIERLTILRKYGLIGKKDIPNIVRIPGTLIIYNEGYIPKAFLKPLPKETKIEEFKLPKKIWNFLDNISLKNFHAVIDNEPVEFVFSLLAKRFRDLYWVQVFPETLSYEPWQIRNIKRQSQKYPIGKIKEIIDKLSEIDIKVKTSKADLISELDLLLIKSIE